MARGNGSKNRSRMTFDFDFFATMHLTWPRAKEVVTPWSEEGEEIHVTCCPYFGRRISRHSNRNFPNLSAIVIITHQKVQEARKIVDRSPLTYSDFAVKPSTTFDQNHPQGSVKGH